MCIAILNLNNSVLTEETVKNSHYNNPDGSGLVWVEHGKLMTYKTMEGWEVVYSKYLEIKNNNPQTHIILHFRIATSGTVDLNNCHPFKVNNDLAFVHNGVIYGLGDSKKSDTNIFNQNYLQKLPSNFLKFDGIIKLIREYIGSSKLIFLDSSNNYTIINKKSGHEDKFGNWFSNYSYLDSKEELNWWEEDKFDYIDKCDFCLNPKPVYFSYEVSSYLCDDCSKKLHYA